jgi:hypothetical protein
LVKQLVKQLVQFCLSRPCCSSHCSTIQTKPKLKMLTKGRSPLSLRLALGSPSQIAPKPKAKSQSEQGQGYWLDDAVLAATARDDSNRVGIWDGNPKTAGRGDALGIRDLSWRGTPDAESQQAGAALRITSAT